ncbi:MAG TPA: AraC family transcriptional regulator [Gemmatimonadaceae bacterium]|jgi:AraC-like DNA-binding protein|nr:AraC family transcriptional regulator [Gemmatimonadaceae bacterium]
MSPIENSTRTGVALWRRRRLEPIVFRAPVWPELRYTLVVVDGPECPQKPVLGPTLHAEGDVYLFAPGIPFDAHTFGTSTYWVASFARHAIALCLEARPRGLPSQLLARVGTVLRFHADEGQISRLVAELDLMQGELERHAEAEHSALPSLINLVLTDVARLRPVPNDLALCNSCESNAATQLVRDVFQVIETRYRSPIGLADVAKAVDRSPAYLTHAVREETGRTVLQWIIERRMREAERLLIDTDQPLHAIASAVGYDNVSYFIRQFAKRHGTPPGGWRETQVA